MKVSENLDLRKANGVLQTAHSLFKRFVTFFIESEGFPRLSIVPYIKIAAMVEIAGE